MDADIIREFLSNAAQSQFSQMLFIFTLAALVHARQVRAEIKTQLESLASVLKEDLAGTRELIDKLTQRVAKIEDQMKPKP